MCRISILLLITVCLFSSCATQHKTISAISAWSYPQLQDDQQFGFSYVDGVLDKTGNKQASRWAKRKHIHVISVRIMNNGKKPVHGMQLSFYNGDEPVERIHNAWLAKKVRQRRSPLMILFAPVWLAEAAFYSSLDDDDDYYYERSYFEEDTPSITGDIASAVDNQRKNENLKLKDELMNFQLERQVLWPGKAVYGIIGIRSKEVLEHLRIVKHDVDFQVVSTY
ncbi:hypothetical protein [uncultured Sunxiuqinia sp.]|uniref:hypothetical protein n=1 Tax=uncultured Sunxiuqinia sp. TaxID=1573825 RepID=UPI002AA96034|nr:hypothetical protein [uncultured Sunxiuqinia sp.]